LEYSNIIRVSVKLLRQPGVVHDRRDRQLDCAQGRLAKPSAGTSREPLDVVAAAHADRRFPARVAAASPGP
jgi:hypothetical protein